MIYDNTLREGLQSPSLFLTNEDKIPIINKLIAAGITDIEIGFIAVSIEEQDAIKRILKHDFQANLYCLCRLLKTDIDDCIKVGCKNVTIFVPASDDLMKLRLKKTEEDILCMIKDVLSYAKMNNLAIRFSCEDATRAPLDRLVKFYSLAIECGAKTLSVPDTSGICTPRIYGELINELNTRLDGKFSTHCHNDLGLATANSLAGFDSGAAEIQTTICGVGERMGNADLSQICVILKKHYANKNYDLIKLKELYELFFELSKYPVHPEQVIWGANQFSHESGLHVRGIVGGLHCYEAFPPSWIGKEHTILYGKLSGMANVDYLSEKHKMELSEVQKKDLLRLIKKNSENKKRHLSEQEVLDILEKQEYCYTNGLISSCI